MKDRSGFFDSDDTSDPRAQRIFVAVTVVGAVFVLLLWAGVTVSTAPADAGRSQRSTSSDQDPGGSPTLPIMPSTPAER